MTLVSTDKVENIFVFQDSGTSDLNNLNNNNGYFFTLADLHSDTDTFSVTEQNVSMTSELNEKDLSMLSDVTEKNISVIERDELEDEVIEDYRDGPEVNDSTVFVGNVPERMTLEDIRKLFGEYGRISFDQLRRREKGKETGSALIWFVINCLILKLVL